MLRSARATVGALLAGALVASLVAFAAPSGATTPSAPGALTPTFDEGVFQEGILESEISVSGSCDSNIVASDVTVLKDGLPTNDVAVVGLDVDAAFGLLIGPGAASTAPTPNVISISLTCQVSGSPATFTGVIGWAQIDVTKTVTGEGPADGEFEITAVCTRVALDSIGPVAVSPSAIDTTTLVMPLKAGETGSIFAVTNGSCDFSETNALGATQSVIDNPTITISSSITQKVSVTNTFPEATPKFTG